MVHRQSPAGFVPLNAVVCLYVATLILVGTAGCYTAVDPCAEDVGVCPMPEAGVTVNEINLAKSSWITNSLVNPPDSGRLITICRADLDQALGEEVIFRGEHGFMVLSQDARAPTVYSYVPIDWRDVLFVDVEADGNAEYLETEWYGDVRFWDNAGSLLWEIVVDYDAAPPFWGAQVRWADVTGDGELEFLVGTDRGVELLTAGGELLSTIGNLPYRRIRLGQFDEDEDFELVTLDYESPSTPQDSVHRLVTWDLDGTKLYSFDDSSLEVERALEYFAIASDPDAPGLDRIMVGCTLYDPEGTEVGSLPPSDSGDCLEERPHSDSKPMTYICTTYVGLEPEPIEVRFRSGTEAFRVELAHSFERVQTYVFGPAGRPGYSPKRTILKVFDAGGVLVYHEVLESRSGPGSFTVVPSDVDGAEVLLVADDHEVLAYSISPAPLHE